MDTTELYKLPKDILVKLITTIQEQTKKQLREDVKKEYSSQLRNVFEKMVLGGQCYVSRCSYIDCDKYIVNDEGGNKLYSNSENFSTCYNCFVVLCEDHLSDMNKIDGELYCNVCYVLGNI